MLRSAAGTSMRATASGMMQAGGLDNEHHDQDKKYDSVRQLGRNVSLAQVLDDAQQDTAEERTGIEPMPPKTAATNALMPGMAPVVGCRVG